MPAAQLRHLNVREEQGILVLTLTESHLHGDKLATALRHELMGVLAGKEARRVILDFQHVTSLSSEVFRPLITLRHKVEESKGRLVLCGLCPEVTRAFSATRLMSSQRMSTSSFEVQPNISTAVASLAGSPSEAKQGRE